MQVSSGSGMPNVINKPGIKSGVGGRPMMNGDPLIVYLSIKKFEHQSRIDRAFVESVFESFSTKVDKDDDDAPQSRQSKNNDNEIQRVVSRANAL